MRLLILVISLFLQTTDSIEISEDWFLANLINGEQKIPELKKELSPFWTEWKEIWQDWYKKANDR